MTAASPLLDRWRAAWPAALDVWSRYTRLREPMLCVTQVLAARQGLSGSFAMIRLLDQSVVIDLESVARLGLQDYAVEILAHEIGHHVLAPGTANDQFRLLARIRRALPTLERHAPMVANLYTDLFINDRLHRQADLRMADIYRLLAKADPRDARRSRVWDLYMRIYEYLWKLEPGDLCPARAAGGHDTADTADTADTDAWLGARLIRVYANDWMDGAGRFATLLLPYLADDSNMLGPVTYLHDTGSAAQGCDIDGAYQIEAGELDEAVHPANDPRISGVVEDSEPVEDPAGDAGGQAREPFEYGEILKMAGIKMSDHDIAIRYYRQRARPYLVPFPVRLSPEQPELHLEGLEPWEIGDPFDEIDWLQSLMVSPVPIPGVTTVRRTYGHEARHQPAPIPVDLDMYVDSSGSMPNPQTSTSYLALAGAIIALSALRAGSRVQVTLWSGKNQVLHTGGFCTDEEKILSVLTGFFGGATCFPIHQLRDTYAAGRTRPAHILQISDDGITTMFDKDERGGSGWDIAARALAVGGAGGTMALNIQDNWDDPKSWGYNSDAYTALRRAQSEQGWHLHAISALPDLLAFAREFSRRHYAVPGKRA